MSESELIFGSIALGYFGVVGWATIQVLKGGQHD